MKNNMIVGLLKTKKDDGSRFHQFNAEDIIRKYGLNAECTEFAKLCGTFNHYIHFGEEKPYSLPCIGYYHNDLGDSSMNFQIENPKMLGDIGIRPVIKLSTMGIDLDKLDDRITEISYFMYPQKIVQNPRDFEWKYINTKALHNNKIKCSMKYYIYSNVDLIVMHKNKSFSVVEGADGKYVRIIHLHRDLSYENFLRDGKGHFISWVKLEPIEWIVDKRADVAVSKKILLPTIPLVLEKNGGSYLSSLDQFLNTTFADNLQNNKSEFKVLNYTKDITKINAIKGNIALQILMKKHNVSFNDIDLDVNGKPFIRTLAKKEN